MKSSKRKNPITEIEKEIKPLTEEENIETLEEHIEDEELQEDADDLNPDDPWAQERLMRLKKNRAQISSIW